MAACATFLSYADSVERMKVYTTILHLDNKVGSQGQF